MLTRTSPKILVATITVALAVASSACAGPGRTGGAVRSTPSATSPLQTARPNPASPSIPVDAAGAVELAVRYVASTDQLMAHSPIGRREILSRLVAPTVLDAHVDALQTATERMATKLGGSVDKLVWVEAPITATVESVTEAWVVVGVWSVSVTGFPGHVPEEVWRTTHVTVTPNGTGVWWVTDATADAGPTPVSSELALPTGWAEFATVSAWTPTIPGEEL